MRTVRQTASGFLYAIISLVLVIGAVALSLAQGRMRPPAAPTQTALIASSNTPLASVEVGARTDTPLADTSSPVVTQTAAKFEYPTTSSLRITQQASTAKSTCGPYSGWVRAYVVQPGDTLYRIATMHNITVTMLQRANCKSGTLIYAGEELWVPFVLAPPTELTIIPTFPTPTEPATPTDTPTPTATETPTQPS